MSNETSMKKIWNMDSIGVAKANSIKDNFKLKHGMFSGIPILCKKDKCPYGKVCYINLANRIENERCPIEIAAIVSRFDMWCEHFDIDSGTDYIEKEDLVDATLIKDLVDLEVQILRAENRIAISGDFIAKTISTIDNKGKAYYEETVSPEAEFKLSLMEKRYKILQLLNSTRKDRAKETKNNNVSEEALGVFKKINETLENLKDIDLDDINLEGDI